MPQARKVHQAGGVSVEERAVRLGVLRTLGTREQDETEELSPKMTPMRGFIQLDVRWRHLLSSRTRGWGTDSSSNTFRLESPVRHPNGDVK